MAFDLLPIFEKAIAKATGANFSTIQQPKHKCDNCGKLWTWGELKTVKRISERVDEGGETPSGECPECGALCYPMPGDEVAANVVAKSPAMLKDAKRNTQAMGRHCAE